MIAVGDHYLRKTPNILIRASTPLAGGLGCSHQEACGVLTGGCMVIGALRGRVSSQEDDDAVQALACRFRERYISAAGASQCETIRNSLPEQEKRCVPVLQAGVRILLDLLDNAREGADRGLV